MQVQKWLQDTQAKDIMTREMVTFDPRDTLSSVAEALLEKRISGGPVVSDGKCVGVVSVNDLIAAEEQVAADHQEFAQSTFWEGGFSLPVDVYEDKLAAIRAKIAPMSQQPVERFMSTDVIDVLSESSLANVVKKMISGHIHRVVVTDENQRLMGLISTIDVLKALNNF